MDITIPINYSFEQDLFSEYLADIFIKSDTDTRLIPCHKLILQKPSQYFNRLFTPNFSDSGNKIIVLNYSYTTICTLLSFIYKGTLSCQIDEISDVVELGDFLSIDGFIDIVDSHIYNRYYNNITGELNTSLNEFELLQLSDTYKLQICLKFILKYIRVNITSYLDPMTSLPEHYFQLILSDDNIYITEKELLALIRKWEILNNKQLVCFTFNKKYFTDLPFICEIGKHGYEIYDIHKSICKYLSNVELGKYIDKCIDLLYIDGIYYIIFTKYNYIHILGNLFSGQHSDIDTTIREPGYCDKLNVFTVIIDGITSIYIVISNICKVKIYKYNISDNTHELMHDTKKYKSYSIAITLIDDAILLLYVDYAVHNLYCRKFNIYTRQLTRPLKIKEYSEEKYGDECIEAYSDSNDRIFLRMENHIIGINHNTIFLTIPIDTMPSFTLFTIFANRLYSRQINEHNNAELYMFDVNNNKWTKLSTTYTPQLTKTIKFYILPKNYPPNPELNYIP